MSEVKVEEVIITMKKIKKECFLIFSPQTRKYTSHPKNPEVALKMSTYSAMFLYAFQEKSDLIIRKVKRLQSLKTIVIISHIFLPINALLFTNYKYKERI